MPTLTPQQDCTCCGKPASYTIQVAVAESQNRVTDVRYYLPNQGFRTETDPQMLRQIRQQLKELPFCPQCVRAVEDNFRATILYLQDEHGMPALGRARP